MSKKNLVVAIVGLVLAALVYWGGSDMVQMVKDALGEVAPVQSDQ